MKKFLLYLMILSGFFAGLELLVRANHSSFFALSDKLLLKLELLKARKNDKIVFLGSSRTLDAVDAKTFDSYLERQYSYKSKSFNSATTGQNIKRFLYNLEEILKRESVEFVVVESSYIDLKDGKLKFKLEQGAEKEKREENLTIETQLQNFAYDNFVSVQVRKAFKPKVFLRLFMVWTSNSVNHDIWFRSNTPAQLFSGFAKDYSQKDLEKYPPVIFKSANDFDRNLKIDDPKFSQVVDTILKYKKKIIFYNPPLSKKSSGKDCLESRQKMYQKVIRVFDTIFIDYSCGGFTKEFLRDPTHLNPDGRIYFSQVLAKDIYEHVLGGKE